MAKACPITDAEFFADGRFLNRFAVFGVDILDQTWAEMVYKSVKYGQLGLSWAIAARPSLEIARINSDLKGSGYELSYGIDGVLGTGLVA